ncbi:DUF1847 domain-containing protein [Megalodesulfovibrio gigas]|uniref:Putative metal binding protein n=2 Tax=Megalodesulfovibrio gigas TaxID=879 RepID=T2G6S6_MEGG1|nr:DUF1847 domain-containing protein [Megalodesulfovibrio gigas]AAW67948.1 hypothetical metal binding protein [Megalodesulfovibrio gigas]AGW11988.1 putative metal binding protein [Megalodesulfovibrio gigas DSM 1382 = ATCC 19364]
MKCATCDEKKCYAGKVCHPIRTEVFEQYQQNPEVLRLLQVSSSIEADHYMKMCRVEETLEFARRMEFTLLGVAFCVGFANEARRFVQVAQEKGFRVSSVCCKVCGIDKDELGVKKLYGPEREVEAICNPVGQAEILNRDETQLNVVLGLCVGHDALFTMHSKAPATTLVVKDRVLGHNPVAALYSNYYRRRLDGEI